MRCQPLTILNELNNRYDLQNAAKRTLEITRLVGSNDLYPLIYVCVGDSSKWVAQVLELENQSVVRCPDAADPTSIQKCLNEVTRSLARYRGKTSHFHVLILSSSSMSKIRPLYQAINHLKVPGFRLSYLDHHQIEDLSLGIAKSDEHAMSLIVKGERRALFANEIMAHRSRLIYFSRPVLSALKSFFPSAHHHRGLFHQYMELHDALKILPIQVAEIYGYSHPESLLERLFEFYGKEREELNKDDRDKIDLIVSDLNSAEAKMKQKVFWESSEVIAANPRAGASSSQRGLANLREIFESLEWILDVVDTRARRRKEVGIPLGPNFDAPSYFRNRGLELEALLSELVDGFTRRNDALVGFIPLQRLSSTL